MAVTTIVALLRVWAELAMQTPYLVSNKTAAQIGKGRGGNV